MNFSIWLESVEMTFITAGGSSYVFSDGKTVRTKALHKYHDQSDVGVKEQSELTVFVDPSAAREIGMFGACSFRKKRVGLHLGHVGLLFYNEKSGSYNLNKIHADSKFVEYPEVGLSPLELWKLDNNDYSWRQAEMRIYSDFHPGSAIVQIG